MFRISTHQTLPHQHRPGALASVSTQAQIEPGRFPPTIFTIFTTHPRFFSEKNATFSTRDRVHVHCPAFSAVLWNVRKSNLHRYSAALVRTHWEEGDGHRLLCVNPSANIIVGRTQPTISERNGAEFELHDQVRSCLANKLKCTCYICCKISKQNPLCVVQFCVTGDHFFGVIMTYLYSLGKWPEIRLFCIHI